jgi:hypothetical protein
VARRTVQTTRGEKGGRGVERVGTCTGYASVGRFYFRGVDRVGVLDTEPRALPGAGLPAAELELALPSGVLGRAPAAEPGRVRAVEEPEEEEAEAAAEEEEEAAAEGAAAAAAVALTSAAVLLVGAARTGPEAEAEAEAEGEGAGRVGVLGLSPAAEPGRASEADGEAADTERDDGREAVVGSACDEDDAESLRGVAEAEAEAEAAPGLGGGARDGGAGRLAPAFDAAPDTEPEAARAEVGGDGAGEEEGVGFF